MAQKYIVDDIVMYKNKIHTIIDTLGLNNYELSYVRHPVNQAELSGVHITTEFLKKNWWKFIGHQMDFGGFLLDIYSKRDILPYLYYYYATNDFSVSICGEVVLPDMKYVHELQHLLFGLGINHEMEV